MKIQREHLLGAIECFCAELCFLGARESFLGTLVCFLGAKECFEVSTKEVTTGCTNG